MMISPRSRLYRLAPAGRGTSLVESLTSYVMRLAAAHHLTPGALVLTSLPSLLPRRVGDRAQAGQAARNGSFANGVRKGARHWLQAVEEATALDLAGLTLAPWALVLSGSHLLRATMAYCPICLDEMAANGLVYEPLAWAIRSITDCAEHRRRLETACWHCGRSQLAFRWLGRPGICSRCKGWLGNPEVPPHESSPGGLDQSRVVASMLLAPPRPESDSSSVGDALMLGIASLGMTERQFANAVGVGQGRISVWKRGLMKMSLPSAAQVCAAGGWDLAAFVDGRIVASSSPTPSARPQVRKARANDWAAVRKEVLRRAADEPPITVRDLARSLGITRRWLRTRLPLETQVLVDRREDWQRRQVEERANRLTALVVTTTLGLLDAGQAATGREVDALLPSPASIRERRLGEAWRQARSDWHAARSELAPLPDAA